MSRSLDEHFYFSSAMNQPGQQNANPAAATYTHVQRQDMEYICAGTHDRP
jgi:hypothetical protein